MFAQVDDEDFDELNKHKWFVAKLRGIYYVGRQTHGSHKTRKFIFLHRYLMKCVRGDGKLIDHKDKDGLNNQKENLRLASYSENAINCKSLKHSESYSKYRGVTWCVADKRWSAALRKDGKAYHLGLFSTEERAALAYNEFAKKIQGEFAQLNDVPPGDWMNVPEIIRAKPILTKDKILEMVNLVKSGKQQREVGLIMGITQSGVSYHVRRYLQKEQKF